MLCFQWLGVNGVQWICGVLMGEGREKRHKYFKVLRFEICSD